MDKSRRVFSIGGLVASATYLLGTEALADAASGS